MPIKAVIFDLDGTITQPFLDFNAIRNKMGLTEDDGPVLEAMEKMTSCQRRRAEEILQSLRLQLEPNKTRVTTFDEGFLYLGVWFEGDAYVYQWKDKRIEVRGDFDWLAYDYVPDGYGAPDGNDVRDRTGGAA